MIAEVEKGTKYWNGSERGLENIRRGAGLKTGSRRQPSDPTARSDSIGQVGSFFFLGACIVYEITVRYPSRIT